MDRASSLIFPGSRTLTGWWRQLQLWQPQALLVGYGYVHRVEAPVQVHHHQQVDTLAQLVLKGLSLQQAPAAPGSAIPLDGLGERLGLPPSILRQILMDMEKTGLVERAVPVGWHLAERGRAALECGRFPIRLQQRRVFPFLEHLTPAGERKGPPCFLPLAECVAASWQVGDSFYFAPGLLQTCIAQPVAWKERWSFPLDVETLEQNSFAPSWQQVIVDRPERVLLILIQSGQVREPEWIGFAAKADGWILYDQTPVLRLPALPDILEREAPAAPAWQEIWKSWCRERNLPVSEAESCTLSHRPPRLDIQAPERFIQRLRAAKSDLLRGEAWVLVGDGYLRTAALLSLPSA